MGQTEVARSLLVAWLAFGALGCHKAAEVAGPSATTLSCAPASVALRAGASVQLQAQANDPTGQPVPGALIDFKAAEGGLVSVTSTGLVTASGRLGTGSVVIQSGSARLEVQVVVTPGEAARIDVAKGAPRAAPAGEALSELIRLRVLDQLGNPVPEAPVEFRLGASGGLIDPTQSKTGEDGAALVRWTLGPKAGLQRLTALVGEGGVVQASLEAMATPGPASRLELRTARLPVAPAGTPLSIAVDVLDAHGNGIARAPVAFRVVRGNGNVSPPAAFTAEDGRAVAQWTLGTRTGENELLATCVWLPGRDVPVKTVATPGAPSRLVLVASTKGEARAGVPITPAPVVRVEDALGNPVPGVPVHFRIAEGPGRVEPELASTDERGTARPLRWVNCAAGPAGLTAEVDGLPPTVIRVLTRLDRAGPKARSGPGDCP